MHAFVFTFAVGILMLADVGENVGPKPSLTSEYCSGRPHPKCDSENFTLRISYDISKLSALKRQVFLDYKSINENWLKWNYAVQHQHDLETKSKVQMNFLQFAYFIATMDGSFHSQDCLGELDFGQCMSNQLDKRIELMSIAAQKSFSDYKPGTNGVWSRVSQSTGCPATH